MWMKKKGGKKVLGVKMVLEKNGDKKRVDKIFGVVKKWGWKKFRGEKKRAWKKRGVNFLQIFLKIVVLFFSNF